MENTGMLQRHFIPVILLLTTISVVPWIAIEPINSIKFLLITVAGFLSVGSIAQNWKHIYKFGGSTRLITFLWITFVAMAFLVFFTSKIGWRQQLFGNSGRNTGLIFYVSIAFISIYMLHQSKKSVEDLVLKAFSIAGTLSIFYGFIQFLSLDPIPWNNPYGALIGFQGNPNFQSSFLGLYAVYSVYQLVYSEKFGKVAIFYAFSLVSSILLIILSQSIQGLFVFVIGAAFLIMFRLKNSKIQSLYYPYLILMFVGFTLSTLGLLQKGPLQFLYQPSVSFRGDYWRAGFKMFQDNPVLGLGHSSFGDYYMSYRDLTSLSGIEGRGPDTFSNSAHNVFIDIASSGGLALTVPYISIIAVSFYFLSKVFGLTLIADKKSALYGALWMAYLLQTIISVQFITLALWGWVFLGMFLRHAIEESSSSKDSAKLHLKQTLKAKADAKEVRSGFLPAVFFIVGILVGILPLRATSVQKSAFESQELERVISAGLIEPQDADRMNQIALVLAKNNQIDAALRILNRASKISPRNHDTWNLIAKLSPAGTSERIRAEKRAKSLNPYTFD